ncbi:MAG: tRNA (adenosine(37)-N6)-threonylcarbamoyltransferase complex ATPase subunit type 1 TsaE [Verrucomicrobiota bacterium]
MTISGKTVITRSPRETMKLAEEIAREACDKRSSPAGCSTCIIALHGNLGSGKTCFVKGLARALGINRPVTSPTFTLINEYPAETPLYHIDLYRLNSPEDAFSLEFERYLETPGVIAIEWAEKAEELIPETAIHIYFEATEEPDNRKITVTPTG